MIKKYIKSYQDFPVEGVDFKCSASLCASKGFKLANDYLYSKIITRNFNKIIGIDARGFIFASILAYKTQKPLILARKSGKLPGKTVSKSYALEYGEACIEIKDEDVEKDDIFIIVDDLIATGGTIQAVIDILEEKDAYIDSVVTLMDLKFLGGSESFVNQGINLIRGVEYEF